MLSTFLALVLRQKQLLEVAALSLLAGPIVIAEIFIHEAAHCAIFLLAGQRSVTLLVGWKRHADPHQPSPRVTILWLSAVAGICASAAVAVLLFLLFLRYGASPVRWPLLTSAMVALIGVGNSIFDLEGDIHVVLRARARKSR